MKKSFLLLVALFGFVSLSFAQEGMKAINKASRSLSTYNLDPKANADKLDKALELMSTAFESDEVKNSTKAQAIKGNILATVANKTINAAILDATTAADKDLTIAMQAYNAFNQAYQLAEKKFEKKEALEGLVKMESILENMAIIAYQNEKWKVAFDGFNATLASSDKLKELGETSVIDDEKKADIVLNAISVGSQPESGVDFLPLLDKAVEMKIDNSAIYQIGYQTYAETNKEKALSFLNKGRELYPSDPGMLFAEINYYIGEGQLEVLIDKLKQAIETEPENSTVYGTLGNVYDQLYTKASEEGDEVKAEDYFQNAKKYYVISTEKDPSNFNSYYGVGALYFNKAAKVGKELNELSSDLSAAGIAKYDKMKLTMTGYYEESFPYLDAAEKLKPNDPLILQAMKEYYVRTNNSAKSLEYKTKLEALQSN